MFGQEIMASEECDVRFRPLNNGFLGDLDLFVNFQNSPEYIILINIMGYRLYHAGTLSHGSSEESGEISGSDS